MKFDYTKELTALFCPWLYRGSLMLKKVFFLCQTAIDYIFYSIFSQTIGKYLSKYFFRSPLDAFIIDTFSIRHQGHFSRNYT